MKVVTFSAMPQRFAAPAPQFRALAELSAPASELAPDPLRYLTPADRTVLKTYKAAADPKEWARFSQRVALYRMLPSWLQFITPEPKGPVVGVAEMRQHLRKVNPNNAFEYSTDFSTRALNVVAEGGFHIQTLAGKSTLSSVRLSLKGVEMLEHMGV